jgi:hypothetical protein
LSYSIKRLLIICTCLFFTGCAGKQPVRIPPDGESVPEPPGTGIMEEGGTLYPPKPEESIPSPSPGDLASQSLMEQAVMFLDEKKPDESIWTLNKALKLSTLGGKIYYYLAKAWYIKGDLSQAEEYNSLASEYLKDDMEWMELIEEQKRRIEQLSVIN